MRSVTALACSTFRFPAGVTAMTRARRSVGEGLRTASPASSSSSTVTTIVVLSNPTACANSVCVNAPAIAVVRTQWARGEMPTSCSSAAVSSSVSDWLARESSQQRFATGGAGASASGAFVLAAMTLRSYLGTQGQLSRARPEAQIEQLILPTGSHDRLAVDPLDAELRDPARLDRIGERLQRGARIPGQREQASPAPLDVEGRLGAREHDVGAGHPLGTAVVVALRPRQRRPVRLGRVGGGEHQRRRLLELDPAGGPQPLHRAGQRELGAAEPLDEVAPPRDAERLQRAQRVVQGREAAGDPLGQHLLAGHDAVPLEQELGERTAALAGVGGRLEQRRSQRPAALDLRRGAGAAGGGAPGRGAGAVPAGAGRGRGRRAPGGPGAGGGPPRPDASPQRPLPPRGGARASLGPPPAQTRPHSASCSGAGSGGTSLSRSVKKHAPAESRVRMASGSGASGGSGRLGAPSSGASSRKYSATRPERLPIAPAPTHTTSPAEHS